MWTVVYWLFSITPTISQSKANTVMMEDFWKVFEICKVFVRRLQKRECKLDRLHIYFRAVGPGGQEGGIVPPEFDGSFKTLSQPGVGYIHYIITSPPNS